MVNILSREEAERLLHYEPETGEFYWLIDRGRGGSIVRAGSITGCVGPRGYVIIRIGRRNFFAHRLAWLLTHGVMPEGEVDHINGEPSDNRIANLRLATHAENSRNAQRRVDNTTGFKGVSRCFGKFRATIQRDSKQMHLGTFATAEQAYDAYCRAARALHGEFARFA